VRPKKELLAIEGFLFTFVGWDLVRGSGRVGGWEGREHEEKNIPVLI
jgi:hypothetical protein